MDRAGEATERTGERLEREAAPEEPQR
jgi:hypothetical protein